MKINVRSIIYKKKKIVQKSKFQKIYKVNETNKEKIYRNIYLIHTYIL